MANDGFDYGDKPDLSDPEIDRQRLFSTIGVASIVIVYGLCASLDVANIFLSVSAPHATARLACTLQPLALIKIPFAMQSANSDPCLGEFHKAIVSLMFFSVKLTIAMVAFGVLWICLKSEAVQSIRNVYRRRFGAIGGYDQELKSFALRTTGIFLFLAACFLLASSVAGDTSTQF